MFELVQRIEIDAPGGRASGVAAVPADHPALLDHFPDRPLLPGTWCLELAAQIAGPLVEEALGDGRFAVLAMVQRARFIAPVELPTTVHIEAVITRREPSTTVVETTVFRGGLLRARAELVFAHVGGATPAAIAARDTRLARWKVG
ncbi:MAG: hypothetical protein WKG01_17150 [Kofleriaceae bacterium]